MALGNSFYAYFHRLGSTWCFSFCARLFIIIGNKTPRENLKSFIRKGKFSWSVEMRAIHQKLWVLWIDLPVNGGIPFVINVHFMQIQHSRGNRIIWQSSWICLLTLDLHFLSLSYPSGEICLQALCSQELKLGPSVQVLKLFTYIYFYLNQYVNQVMSVFAISIQLFLSTGHC